MRKFTRQALQRNPQGKRKVGRPCNTWRQSYEDELKANRQTWGTFTRIAQDRVRWRTVVKALCFPRNNKNQVKEVKLHILPSVKDRCLLKITILLLFSFYCHSLTAHLFNNYIYNIFFIQQVKE